MSDQWGTREQPSERDSGIRAEHAYLFLAVFSVSAAVVLYIVAFQAETFEVNRGAYAILVAFFVAGYCGWLSRSAERRMRRVAVGELRRQAAAVEALSDQVRRLAATVDELRDQVHKQKTYLPAPRRSSEGQRYIGAVAVGAEDDAAHTTVGIDPVSIDAARRISSRLRSVDNE